MAKPVSVFSAAKRLGEHSGWTLTHLQMQKMLYICHMYYMGESGEPLIDGYFEAWHYGPVNVDLYHHLKACRLRCCHFLQLFQRIIPAEIILTRELSN